MTTATYHSNSVFACDACRHTFTATVATDVDTASNGALAWVDDCDLGRCAEHGTQCGICTGCQSHIADEEILAAFESFEDADFADGDRAGAVG